MPVEGNPFWSQKTIGELVLQRSRPRDLPSDGELHPVPGDDHKTRREVEGEHEEGSSSRRREKRSSSPQHGLGRGERRSKQRWLDLIIVEGQLSEHR